MTTATSFRPRVVFVGSSRRPEDTLPVILTPAQAAPLLGIHQDTVREWLEAGKLPHLDRRPGEPWRVITTLLLEKLHIPYSIGTAK